jgi:hypothetical protein
MSLSTMRRTLAATRTTKPLRGFETSGVDLGQALLNLRAPDHGEAVDVVDERSQPVPILSALPQFL